MIAYLEGTILSLEDHALVLMVNAIGYVVYVPDAILSSVKEQEHLAVYIHHYVRDDAEELFGFATRAQLHFFQRLLRIVGVGPKLALAVLSHLSLEEIKRAIIHGDTALLSSVSGVGRKTAERIVLDLKESIDILPDEIRSTENVSAAEESMSAMEALLGLGYSKTEALDALYGIESTLLIEDQIRAALKKLQPPS